VQLQSLPRGRDMRHPSALPARPVMVAVASSPMRSVMVVARPVAHAPRPPSSACPEPCAPRTTCCTLCLIQHVLSATRRPPRSRFYRPAALIWAGPRPPCSVPTLIAAWSFASIWPSIVLVSSLSLRSKKKEKKKILLHGCCPISYCASPECHL
jgi:hypothetical protein